jgi:hypothetical protein
LETLGLNNNSFCGSLEPLKNIVNLKYFNISDTDVNDGVEYLPEKLLTKGIVCYRNLQKPERKISEIIHQLNIIIHAVKNTDKRNK